MADQFPRQSESIRALMEAEGLTYSGAYKRVHRDRAREYARRDNAKRSKIKQESWRGVCEVCGGETSRRDVARCRSCFQEVRRAA